MAKPQTFNEKAGKIFMFLIVCRLYIRIKIRNNLVEEQVQWALSYIQRGSADIWKKNVMENLKSRSLSYTMVEEILADLKQKFGGKDNEIMKIAELKKIKQSSKTMKEFI